MNRQNRRKGAAHRRYLDTMITEGGGKPHNAGTKFVVSLQIITKAGLLNTLQNTSMAAAAEKGFLWQIVDWLERLRRQGQHVECGTCDRTLTFFDFNAVLIVRPYNDHVTTAKATPLCRPCAARPLSELAGPAAQGVFGRDIDVRQLELPGLFARSRRA